MKLKKAILCGITVSVLGGAGVRSLMAADVSDGQRQIIVELAKLRADVLLILAETQQMKVEKLRLELNLVQQRQKDLVTAEARRREEVNELDQQLSGADLPEQIRPEIEAVRTGIVDTMSGIAKQEPFSVQKRQAELKDQLRQETQRFIAWKQQAQLLASAVAQ